MRVRGLLAGIIVGVYLIVRLLAVLISRPYEVQPPVGNYCKDDETWFMTQYQIAPTVLPPCY